MDAAPGKHSLMYCLIIALEELPVTSSRELCASLKAWEQLCSTQHVIPTQRARLGPSEVQTLLINK